MSDVQVRNITGIEADRIKLRSAALRIIRIILDQKMASLRNTRKDWLAPPPLSTFTRLEPLGFGLPQDDWWTFNPRDC